MKTMLKSLIKSIFLKFLSRFIELFNNPNVLSIKTYIEDAFIIRDDLRKPLNDETRSSMRSGDNLYPYYGANGQLDSINDYISDCDALCVAEDCGSYGKEKSTSYIIRGKSWVNNHAHVLVPKDNCLLEYANMYFYLFDCSSYVSGTTRQKLTQAQMKKIKFEIPSIDKQREFSDYVNQIDKSKFLLQQMIEKLELLKKSRFIELFGFSSLKAKKSDWVKLSEVACVVTGTTPKTSVPEYWDGNFKWITPAEINNETKYIYDSARKITEEGIKSASLKPFPKGTVILTSRAPIGKVAIAGDTLYCNQGFKNVICSEKLLPEFLFTLLKNSNSYLNSLGRGATFKEISKQIVDNLKVPVPSLERQKQYNQFEQQIDKSKFLLQQMIEKLELLKKSRFIELFKSCNNIKALKDCNNIFVSDGN